MKKEGTYSDIRRANVPQALQDEVFQKKKERVQVSEREGEEGRTRCAEKSEEVLRMDGFPTSSKQQVGCQILRVGAGWAKEQSAGKGPGGGKEVMCGAWIALPCARRSRGKGGRLLVAASCRWERES